ncbi:MAG TPA: DUF4062 domain-containing protein [Syntrophales bacterium]|nr:DUF4062 domain-containing protein [Syntrophales bacterium]
MESKLQIFISSTYTDLIPERQAAVESILKAGHIPAGMELFTAGDRSQWEVIQRWITDADIYMLILGGRYGSIEPDSGLSYTELEYDFAVSSGKPHFAVVISDGALETKVKSSGSSVLEKDHPDKLKTFRKKVLSKMSSFFEDSKDVKLAVLETVPQLAAEYEIKGWVRAIEIPDTKALADELSRLHAENRNLREKLSTQAKELDKKGNTRPGMEEEFSELYELLADTKIDMTTAKKAFKYAKNIPDLVSLLDLTFSCRDALMSGVTNQMGINDYQSFIFFTLCPRLQTYDLVQNEKVAGVRYRRYAITKKGTQFLAYIDKVLHKKNSQQKASTSTEKVTAQGVPDTKQADTKKSTPNKAIDSNKKATGGN